MDASKRPIGLFDSGVGGLTVMKEIMGSLPSENLIYFGDTARLPYGNKSPSTIVRYSIDNAIFLLEKQIKLLVIACNTASAFALPKLQSLFNIPIIGVIDPGAEKSVSVSRSNRIGVLGTKGTILSGAYQKAIHRLNPLAEVLSVSCPLFVPLVEEYFQSHPATTLVVKEYLKDLKLSQIDTLLLGCTHYPLLSPLIHEEMGSHVTIVDSASTCADKVASTLAEMNLLSPKRTPTHQYFVSDDPVKFRHLGEQLFGFPLSTVECVNP